MLESIRQIGIFMIVAQTVMHFAANGQYEKYMKIIAGVIVLLLFIRPFISGSEEQVTKWQEEIRQMMEQIELQSGNFDHMAYEGTSTETVVIRQIEEEITRRLNEVSADHGCRVAKTTIALMEQEGELIGSGNLAGEYEFDHVRITVRDQRADGEDMAAKVEEGKIQIGEITVKIGSETDTELAAEGREETEENAQELRQIFAQTLGITEDRVEVVYLGGW